MEELPLELVIMKDGKPVFQKWLIGEPVYFRRGDWHDVPGYGKLKIIAFAYEFCVRTEAAPGLVNRVVVFV